MSKVNKNIESVKKLVNESVSSVFSKEDVLKLFKRIEELENPNDDNGDKIEISREWLTDKLEDMKADIIGNIDNTSIGDICDLDDIELTLEGREISIDYSSVYFNGDSITSELSDSFDEFIDEINNL